MPDTFVPTRYLSYSYAENGSLVLYSSLTGAIGAVPAEQASEVRSYLRRSASHPGPLTGILKDLQTGGFLVPVGTDEWAIVHNKFLNRYKDDYLHLIIMPTEQCNFRCVYCYESFIRGQMSEGIKEGVKRYVSSQKGLKQLIVAWFGGEPLLASKVVIDLSNFFHRYVTNNGIEYHGSATTNGYFLTPEIAQQIIPAGIRDFQITLDGVEEEHDQRRILQHGGKTFHTIMKNLRYLKSTDLDFEVMIRHNFDVSNADKLQEFIAMLQHEFGNDPRFSIFFFPIAQLGGSNDPNLAICEGKTLNEAAITGKRLAVAAGLRNALQIEHMQPNGNVCYAANPRAFVIGSDGSLYKCTVELDYHDRNIVGYLREDGHMDLDWRKMALWTESHGMDAEEHKPCYSCFFSPACAGASCPKEWMDCNEPPCPTEKVTIRKLLPVLYQQAMMPKPSIPSSMGSICTK